MDFSKITSTNVKLDLLHPGTGEALGLQFEVLPPDHADIKQQMRRLVDLRRQKERRNQVATAADDERASVELCTAAVVGWEWTNEAGNWNGERPPFNKATLSEMLAIDWLRLQVDRQLADDKDFFRSSRNN